MRYVRCSGCCLKGKGIRAQNLKFHVKRLTRHMDTRLQHGVFVTGGNWLVFDGLEIFGKTFEACLDGCLRVMVNGTWKPKFKILRHCEGVWEIGCSSAVFGPVWPWLIFKHRDGFNWSYVSCLEPWLWYEV